MSETIHRKSLPTDPDGGFDHLSAAIQKHFAAIVKQDQPLFHTDAPDLFQAFLDGLPTELRQHYQCSCCRHFIHRFGDLVVVQEDGRLSSAVWPSPKSVPAAFQRGLEEIRTRVERAQVTGVFLTSLPVLGVPITGEWPHLSLPVPADRRYKNLITTAGQAAATKREEIRFLQRGLDEFPATIMGKALALIRTGNFYRSDKVEGMLHWLLGLHEMRSSTKEERLRNHRMWAAVAVAPVGFAHVKSGVLGTLFEDIAAGLSQDEIRERWATKMSPSSYMRAQVAPSAGNIAQAEKVISALKASGSLDRRYVRRAELDRFLWRAPAQAPSSTRSTQEEKSTKPGIFSHIIAKGQDSQTPTSGAKRLTWNQFLQTVLPEATWIEAQIPASSDRFMAMVTAVNPEAPPILQWDNEEERNPVSWYYASGIDAEIKRRVLAAGGTHEGCDIRVSLLWNNRNDLDLHVITPSKEHIYFGAKKATCGGWLDVDMNVRGETDKPVENIRWLKGAAKPGTYQVYVQNYRFHEKYHSITSFRIELEVNGEVFQFDGQISPRLETGSNSDVQVTHFDFSPGKKLNEAPINMHVANEKGTWNVTPGSWVPVTMISLSPNLWGAQPLLQHGRHLFFLLDGCRDTRRSNARGFFVETLRSDFFPIRATMEAYAASAEVADAENSDACGLGMSDQSPWDLLLRVTSTKGVKTYLIEQWDK